MPAHRGPTAPTGGDAVEAAPPPIAAQLQALLPPEVVLRHAWIAAAPFDLPDAERAAVARAVPQRQREYAAGRHCARAALHALAGHRGPLPAAADRLPAWPAGTTGSIAHDRRWSAAAVAHTPAVAAIGIDVEMIERFAAPGGPAVAHAGLTAFGPAGAPPAVPAVRPDGDPAAEPMPVTPIEPEVATAAEARRWLHGRAAPVRLRHLAWLFCAKEACFKAHFPLTGAWLDFTDAEVLALPQQTTRGRCTVRLLRAAPPFPAGHTFDVGVAAAGGRVCAALVLRAADVPAGAAG